MLQLARKPDTYDHAPVFPTLASPDICRNLKLAASPAEPVHTHHSYDVTAPVVAFILLYRAGYFAVGEAVNKLFSFKVFPLLLSRQPPVFAAARTAEVLPTANLLPPVSIGGMQAPIPTLPSQTQTVTVCVTV